MGQSMPNLISESETAASLRRLADRYRGLTDSTWDLKALSLLQEMIREYENAATSIEEDASVSKAALQERQ